jgi:hypothetical protein
MEGSDDDSHQQMMGS